MARPLRIEYPGAFYHVMNRGNQRRDVFHSTLDCETFLEKLDLYSDRYHVNVHCYCLMTNHFHLLLGTPEANLSKFMQVFLNSFTMTINRRGNKTGHLFHGRYKAHLVENGKYLSVLSRYIHLNPVRTKATESLPVSERKRFLTSYPWSSYSACVGLSEMPDFLNMKPVLRSWGDAIEKQMKSYRAYVENGLYKGVDNPFDLAIRQHIIGSEEFAEEIARKHLLSRPVRDAREEKELLKARRVIPPREVVDLVAETFDTSSERVLARKGKHRQARKAAMFLCCQHCLGKHSLTALSEMFSVSISGLTKMREIVKLSDDEDLKRKMTEVENKIRAR